MPTETPTSGIDMLTATRAVLNGVSKMTRFLLLQFSIQEDPKTRFSCRDQISETQRIYSDFKKYGFLMQNLEWQVILIPDIQYTSDYPNSKSSSLLSEQPD